MNPDELAKKLLEAADDSFNAEEYVKDQPEEASTQIYAGPLATIIIPHSVHAINDYLYGDRTWTPEEFQRVSKYPLFVVYSNHDRNNQAADTAAIVQFETDQVWNSRSGRYPVRDLSKILAEPIFKDAQSGFTQYFQSQIAQKKNAKQAVANLVLIGRTDLAANYSRYLGHAKLPMGTAIETALHLQKAGKRQRNKIARLMKRSTDVLWKDNGFYLLFDDWSDTVNFFEKDGRHDFQRVAKDVFDGETRSWLDAWSYVDVDNYWDSISEKNIALIRQLLVGLTCLTEDNEEFTITTEMASGLDDEEVMDVVKHNKDDATEDIVGQIKRAAVDAEESAMDEAYTREYTEAVLDALGADKTKRHWMQVKTDKGTQEKLAFFFQYSTLEEWLAKWREEHGEDEYEFDGDISDLAFEYAGRAEPSEDISHNGIDDEYFNSQLEEALHEVNIKAPARREPEPGQTEMPLDDPDKPAQPLQRTKTVMMGEPPEQRRYKGVPEPEAKAYQAKVPKASLSYESLVTALLEREEGQSAFHMPENFDKVTEGSGWDMWAGANDWEIGHSAACVMFSAGNGLAKRIWMEISHPDGNDDSKVQHDGQEACKKRGKEAVSTWISIARKLHGSTEYYDWSNCFEDALDHEEMTQFVGKHGCDKTKWTRDVVEAIGAANDCATITETAASGFWIMNRTSAGMAFLSKVGWVREQQKARVFASPEQAQAEFMRLQLDPGEVIIVPIKEAQEVNDPKAFVQSMNCVVKCGKDQYLKSAQDGPWAAEWTFQRGEALVMPHAAGQELLNRIQAEAPDHPLAKTARIETVSESSTTQTPERLDEDVYKNSTTQIDLPDELGQHIISWGKLNVPDDALYIDEDGGSGRETEQHVTVLYGLKEAAPSDALKDIIGNTKPFLVELSGVTIFENEKYDVVKLDVISEELTNLSNAIRKACPNNNKFPDYHGHVTIAYVKPGRGKEFVGQDVFKAAQVSRDFWAYEVLFKGAGDSDDPNRVVDVLYFDKEGDPGHEDPEPDEKRYAMAESAGADVDPKEFVKDIVVPYVLRLAVNGSLIYWNGALNHWTAHKPDATHYSYDEAVKLSKQWLSQDIPDVVPDDSYLPEVPESLEDPNEQVDPKQFVADQNYVVRSGIGAMTRYLQRGGGQAIWREDPDDATAMQHQDAVATVDALRKTTYDRNLRIEMIGGEREPWVAENDDDVDPKEFLNDTPYKCVIRKNRPKDRLDREFYWNAETVCWGPLSLATVLPNRAAGEDYLRAMQANLPGGVKTFNGASVEPYVQVRESDEGENTDPKQFVQQNVPPFHQKKWEGNDLVCACGKWRYSNVGNWSSSIPNALKEFTRHVHAARKQERQMQEAQGPLEDDGLPGDVTSFLRKVRSKRKKVSARPVL